LHQDRKHFVLDVAEKYIKLYSITCKNKAQYNVMISTVFQNVLMITVNPNTVSYLQETDSHQYKTIRRNASSEHFIQISLKKKLFENQHQFGEHWKPLLEIFYKFGWLHSIAHVETNVHLHIWCLVCQLYNWNLWGNCILIKLHTKKYSYILNFKSHWIHWQNSGLTKTIVNNHTSLNNLQYYRALKKHKRVWNACH
jgi:hypothetical protein